MCVHSAALLPSGFYLHAFFSGLHRIVRINPLNNKVWVAIEITVLNEDACVIGEAGSQHVGQDTRHDRGTKHVVQPLESFRREMSIHIEEKVVDILNCETKVVNPQFVRKRSMRIEVSWVHNVPFHPRDLSSAYRRSPETPTFRCDSGLPSATLLLRPLAR